MSNSRIVRALNRTIFYPLIVKPLRCRIDDLAADIAGRFDIQTRVLLNAIKGDVDLSSKSLPLIFVQDVETLTTLKGEITFMQLTNTQKVRIEFGKPLNRKGGEAAVQEGSVSISVTDGSATVEQDADNPFAATIVAVSPTADPTQPGAVVITADADLGEGVRNIQGVEPLLVVPAEAVGFGPATIGEPEEQ